MAFVNLDGDELRLTVPRPRFTDARMVEWRITAQNGTRAGDLDVRPWSEGEITRYHARLRRWHRYGARLVPLVQRGLGRKIEGGLVGAACRRLDVPLHLPPDRTMMIHSCYFQR